MVFFVKNTMKDGVFHKTVSLESAVALWSFWGTNKPKPCTPHSKCISAEYEHSLVMDEDDLL